MNPTLKPDGSSAEQRTVEPSIGPEIQQALTPRADEELAHRSLSGSLVYFVVTILLAVSTPYYQEHPAILIAIAVIVLAAGLLRTLSARRLLRAPAQRVSHLSHMLRASIYATAGPWGLFCAISVYLYPAQWTSTFLMLSTAAFASGATTSLAPDFGLAVRALLLLVVPTIVAAAFEGDPGYLAFAGATAIYLAFLVAQAKGNARAFWQIAVAAECEKQRNSEDRQRIEAERATLAAAIEQAAEEILITDTQGIIQYCNPAFERLTGYSRAEVVGRTPSFLRSGKHDEAFYRQVWTTILQNRVWQGRFTNRRKDGTLYEAEGNISPIHDADGRLTGFVSTRHDATQRLKLEAQLRQSQKLESVGRLAGGVAHDFNNLLTVILGYNRMLLEEHSTPGDPLHECVQEISAAGQRAAALTRQLLSFSRKQILMPRAIALDALVTEMRPMLQRLVGEDIRVEAPPAPAPIFVRADPDQMSQILMNLAANARDAMPQGGTLVLSVEEAPLGEVPAAAHERLIAGPTVRLTVSDTGSGMDEETRLRLFEPFFTTKEPGHGTGLGLATVYGIVEQSEGFIQVRSEPGKGAAFEIYLPRLGGGATVPEKALAPPRGGSETILLVEDQEDLRRLVAMVLQSRGYTVLDACDGNAALRLAAATPGPIDLLLTDVVMPDITGKEVADRMRELRPGTRVLYMSGYPGDVIARKGVLDRGVMYLAKPFTIEGLASKVREALDSTFT